ncbi:MAG TPA: sulfotransferase [Caulobacteraceae bacterium]
MDIQNSIEAVKAAVAANDLPRAIHLAGEAVQRGAEDPLVYNVAAHGLQVQRRYPEAMDLLVRAARIAPRDPFVMIGIGQLSSQLGRWVDAEAAFRGALEIDPSLVAAHHGLGLVLEMKDELDAARQCFEEAVEHAPGFPDPLGSLALQAVKRKDIDEARSLAERALALDPFQTAAAMALAHVEYESGEFQAAASRAMVLLNRGELAPLHESSLWRLIGDVLDSMRKPLEAFEAYRRGNNLFLQVYRSQVDGAGLERGVEFVGRLKKDFEEGVDLDWSAPAAVRTSDEPSGHVFMTGYFRSGTTLLEQILASHPDIETMEEISILDDIAGEFFGTTGGLDRLATLSVERAAELRAEYWRRIRSRGLGAKRGVFVDKLPLANLWTPFIAKIFPDAKILWARRDPRDVVLSCFRNRFKPGPLQNDMADIERGALLYAGVMDLFETYRARLPLDLHVLRHEDLVEDFDAQVKALCDFIGVPWREEMRDFSETAKNRRIRTPSARQVVRGLNAEGVARWRPYAPALEPILPILAPWAERFGYPAA